MEGPGPLPHVPTRDVSTLSLSAAAEAEVGKHAPGFNCGFIAAAVASPGLAVPEGNPAPAHLRGFQATQDIFSFCYPCVPLLSFPVASLPTKRGACKRGF